MNIVARLRSLLQRLSCRLVTHHRTSVHVEDRTWGPNEEVSFYGTSLGPIRAGHVRGQRFRCRCGNRTWTALSGFDPQTGRSATVGGFKYVK